MPCVFDLEPAVAPKLGEGSKVVHRIDPCKDPRWSRLLAKHPRASVFHSTAWLQALSRTYGYEPVAYVTCRDDGELANGIVFCRVESRLTGRRLVSLPFSDHCDPLVDSVGDLQLFATTLEEESREALWRYIEIRSVEQREIATPLSRSDISYSFHELDLRPDLETLLRSFHKNSIQRKIRRAEREGLTYDEGSSELLDSFYRLLTITRRRHQIPPQPKKWFRNLMDCFGEGLKIRVARKDGRVMAGMLTLRYKDTLVYKYGCSDTRFNSVGGMHFLLWKAIQEAKSSGLRTLDLGRTDADQTGLLTFKNRWGTTRQVLTYSRYVGVGKPAQGFAVPATHWRLRTAKRVFAHLHPALLSMIGRVLYRHGG